MLLPCSLPLSRFSLVPSDTQIYRRSAPNCRGNKDEPRLLSTNQNPVFPLFPATIGRTPKVSPFSDAPSCCGSINVEAKSENQLPPQKSGEGKNFWGAVGLIVGTAVGPGMLGLPAATIKSGPLPSTVAILLSWVYVISSIILVAELSFAAMEEDGVAEVSFTGLATKALGPNFGVFVAVVYASLSFSLLVACVSGIGSIVSQWFPLMNVVLAHALFPLAVGITIVCFPFHAIDAANRVLCLLMLLSITGLVTVGLSVARANVLASFAHASWDLASVLPAIPVTVLTLGFHVITPFICKLAGNSVSEARKAILMGGLVPFVMVLSWNLIVLGLAGIGSPVLPKDPISLLLSVSPAALSAVQGFAFSALATSLIGYAISFPKQLVDTAGLISRNYTLGKPSIHQSQYDSSNVEHGKVGMPHAPVNLVMLFVLSVPVFIASFFPSTFSRALDFAGVYVNCFLFGILPPAMVYLQQSRKKLRSSILMGGDFSLLLLFGISVILGIWH